jgi:predicted neutral ceramidase superfamily lipid hydrolase
MNTTSIFVEILIIGLQAGIWLIALGFGLAGADWLIYIHSKYSSLLPFVTLPAFAVIYTIGIVLDRVSDVLFLLFFPEWIRRLGHLLFQGKSQRHSREHIFLLISDGKGTNFFEYIRSRMRIVRAVTLNTVTSIPCVTFAYIKSCNSPACSVSLGGATLALLLSIITLGVLLIAYSLLVHTYDARMSQAALVINHRLCSISTEL